MRKTVLLLLLAAPVLAQSLDQQIGRALDSRISPEERARLLREITATDDGTTLLGASAGLDPVTDSEVVHAVVYALFNSERFAPALESGRLNAVLQRVCRLLEHDAHRAKIEARIEEAARTPGAGESLAARLAEIANGVPVAAGKDPALRRWGVRALGAVPRRSAIVTIVGIWQKDGEDPAVRRECKTICARLIVAQSPQEAAQYLADHPYDTYDGLLRARVDKLLAEVVKLREHQKRALERAPADEAFSFLVNGDPEGRRISSERLLALASERRFEPLDGKTFASRVFDAFLKNRDREPAEPETLAHLCNTLAVLWKGDDKAPLRQAKTADEVLAAVAPLSGAGPELLKVGEAAVGLLKAIGAEAKIALVEFARDFEHAAVSKQAIQILGRLAQRSKASRDFIGPKLAEMLARGARPEVRAQLLSTLAEFGGVEGALAPIRRFLGLDPGGPADPELSGGELLFCMTILRRIESDASFASLVEVSEKYADEGARVLAVRSGLLPWTARQEEVFAHVAKLLADPNQGVGLKTGVLAALGDTGQAAAHDVLRAVAADDSIDAALRAAAVDADLTLGERLVATREGTDVRRTDLEIALTILELRGDTAQDRRERLARAIVVAGTGARLPVGTARYRLAQAYREREDADAAEVIRLMQDAAAKAAEDKLGKDLERELCLELRRLLVESKPDAEGYLKVAACDQRLAELTDDVPLAIDHLLNGAGAALLAQRRARMEELLQLARAKGPLNEAAQARYETLTAKAKELPAGS